MKTKIFTTALVVAGFVAVGAVALNAMMIPDVYVSYSSNECVKVVNHTDTVYGCDSLPKKYNHIWVE